MTQSALRWARDLGFGKRIKPCQPNVELEQHGLKGPLKSGELGFNRQITRRHARKDAEDGLPVSDAMTQDQWSEREQEIAERAETVRTGLTTWLGETAAAVRNFVHDCTPGEVHPDQLQEAIKAEEEDYRHFEADDTEDARVQHEAAAEELEAFRAAHGERIGKRTPDIKKNIEQTVAVLLFVMILEGAFNALLFKDAQGGGLLGGMMVAFGISAVNVGVGVIAGFFGLRYLNHPNRAAKIAGGVIAGVTILFGLFLNLFIAHFRDATEAALIAAREAGTLNSFSMFDLAPGAVIAGMFPNVVGLDSLVAFGLLFIGLAVFGVAVYEGYDRISDRYPGYGRVWRKERLAYERRQQVRTGVRDDLADYFTGCRNWFETQASRHLAAKREIEKAMNLLETRRDFALSIAKRAGEQERSQKVVYRQAHRRQRNALRETLGDQAAIPAYFDEIVTPVLPDFDTSDERNLASKTLTAIDQNITALTLTRQWLESHVQEVQQGLSSIDKRVAEEIAKAREARLEREETAARKRA